MIRVHRLCELPVGSIFGFVMIDHDKYPVWYTGVILEGGRTAVRMPENNLRWMGVNISPDTEVTVLHAS